LARSRVVAGGTAGGLPVLVDMRRGKRSGLRRQASWPGFAHTSKPERGAIQVAGPLFWQPLSPIKV